MEKTAKKNKVVLTLYLEPILDEKVRKWCEEEERSMAWVVTKLLAEKFGSGEKKRVVEDR